ncbi:MAG TPA: ATP-binding protein [Xanthomonadaceae bacterium]|jgi:signal transduction histidine kinase
MSTRRRLSRLLLLSHIGLVLMFAVLLLATGVGTIRTAVIGQARTEAERSVSEAHQRLHDWYRELNVAGDLLAEQPTLRFYLARGQITKARGLVEDFHKTSAVSYVRVQQGAQTVAEIGQPPPGFTTGLMFDGHGVAWRVVQRGIANVPDASIVVAEAIGDRLDVRPATDLINAQLLPLPGKVAGPDDPWNKALREVASSGEPDTFEALGKIAAARIVRVREDDGRPSAMLAATVDQQWVEHRTVEWLAAFSLTGILTAVLALALAVVLAARIGRPFAQLAREAERLGSGDLETPVVAPATFLAEPVALAASLEEMRRQVATLTATERNQREELDAVLDGVDEGIVGLDAEGHIRYANRQFLALVGRAREEVFGQPIDDVLTPAASEDGPPTAATVGLPPTERVTPAGQMRHLVLRRMGTGGDPQVLVVRDENAIEAARAMRDRILANLSHELQTPLSAQIAAIELLRDHLRGSSDDAAIQLAEAQYRGAMRLSHLVDNLLESVRIESGEMRLRREPVDLAAVVADATDLIQPLIDQRNQKILRNIRPGPSFTGDPQRLASVMVNLLSNANKFAPDHSTIWVDIEWALDAVTVWVEDEGPGLPPMREEGDLFAPFRRSPKEEPRERGTGLGLAIVHALVTAHGGKVITAPPLVLTGARVGIALPLTEDA